MARVVFATLIVTMRLAGGPLSPFFSPPAVITATATDAAHNLYIAGSTTQENLPTTPGAFQTDPECLTCSYRYDFVAKISNRGTLVFATYLEGIDYNESIAAIALDASQNVYVTGSLMPIQAIIQYGPPAGFIDELSSDGSRLLARTVFSGVHPSALAVAPSGNIFATGWTNGDGTFPATPGAIVATKQPGTQVFVIQFDPALSKPVYAALLGGDGNDLAYGIAVDAEGQAYVTGTANVAPGFQAVFVVKLNATGSALLFGSFFDANPISAGVGIALDSIGVYIAGVTSNPNVPLSQNAFLKMGTQFAAKIALDGSAVLYQTLLPGPDSATIIPQFQIAVDNSGDLLILSGADTLVPTTPDSFSPCTSGGTGTFVLQLDPAGASRTYGSYLPGGLAIRGDGQVWYSDASGALDSLNIHDPLPPGPRCVADSLTYLSRPLAPGKLVSLFGPNVGPDQPANLQLDASGKASTYIGGVSVYFNGIAAPLLYAGQNQINAVVPFEIAGAPESSIVMLKDGVQLNGPTMPVVAVAPAFVTTSEGCLAAVNPDGSINSRAHPAGLGSVILAFGEGAGLMSSAVTGGIGQGASQIVAPVTAQLQEFGTGLPGQGPAVTAPITVLWAGDAPGEVEGVFQLNLELPESFVTGMQMIQVNIGGVNSGGQCIWIGPRN